MNILSTGTGCRPSLLNRSVPVAARLGATRSYRAHAQSWKQSVCDKSRMSRNRQVTRVGDLSNAEVNVHREAGVDAREDDVLPDSLAGALTDAAESTALALQRSTNRCRVEIIMPEFWDPISGPIFPDKGDNEKFWKMIKRFIDALVAQTGAKKVKVIYPDWGAAVMCKNWWPDAPYEIAALPDRKAVSPEDDLIIFAAADPMGAENCRRIVRQVTEQDEATGVQRPMVMFNPRLGSGEAGIGLNYRRLQQEFLSTFMVSYSLQPIGDDASVFRRFPGMWVVFAADPELPGRYRIAKEMVTRPGIEDLDYIINSFYRKARGESEEEPKPAGFMDQVSSAVRGMQSFMRALNR